MKRIYSPLYKNNILKIILIGFCIAQIAGCKKFLDEKPEKRDVLPTTLNDLQTLLDNSHSIINANSSAAIAELIADNYYVTTQDWQSRASSSVPAAKSEAAHYIWEGNAIPYSNGWNLPYERPIYYSNVVLDQLPTMKVNKNEEAKFNSIKGSALFHRAFNFWTLAQVFCKPYSEENKTSPGIVLRLTSNVSAKSERATVGETYEQVINDLMAAAALLPETTIFPTRPSRGAAHAMLARVYLSMRDYANAGTYANLALQSKNTLLDYNAISSPIATFNPEVVYHNHSPAPILIGSTRAKIDSVLYRSYDVKDLRKNIFFRANTGANANTYSFRGSYHGISSPSGVFDGIAVDELYLIRAECNARSGKTTEAMADLNTLLEKRWESSSWTPFTANSSQEALEIILRERRKELVFRGLRWSDIRRLNLENRNITLERIIAGTSYKLPPNDARSVLLIPWEEINRSGLQQNPR